MESMSKEAVEFIRRRLEASLTVGHVDDEAGIRATGPGDRSPRRYRRRSY